jgi:hypothetical protein
MAETSFIAIFLNAGPARDYKLPIHPVRTT